MAESSAESLPTPPAHLRRWLLVISLLGISGGLLALAGLRGPSASAQPAEGASEVQQPGKGVVAVAGLVAPDTPGLYLLDTERGTLCVYRYDPRAKRLALLAARTYLYDAQLDEYNCEKPTPREVHEMIEQQRRLKDVPTTRSATP